MPTDKDKEGAEREANEAEAGDPLGLDEFDDPISDADLERAREADPESDLYGVPEDPTDWDTAFQTPVKTVKDVGKVEGFIARTVEPKFRQAVEYANKPGVLTAATIAAGLPMGVGLGVSAFAKGMQRSYVEFDKKVARNKTAGMDDFNARVQATRDSYVELGNSIPTSKGEGTPRETVPVTDENNYGKWWEKFGLSGGISWKQGFVDDGTGRKFWVDRRVLHPNYAGVIQWQGGRKTYPGDPGDPRTIIREVGDV